ncbi:MAG: potassium transporter Kef [Bacteroidales bacterium]|nr:potassium transporter Kef [Bacteroidales bacterium]
MVDTWHIDAIWISIAFVAGYFAKKINLPPLIGFLATGFLLNFSGVSQGNITIHAMAELGVMLLLFNIGLKINIKSLFHKEIWATASIHTLLTTLAFGSLIAIISTLGIGYFTPVSFQTALIIGFALSFSSTVFTIKILEERGEVSSFHGNTAIGILVIQDVLAVVFLTVSKSQWPSIWALGLPIYLWLIRYLLYRLLKTIDHGELLTLFGFFAAFVAGAMSFDLVGIKPDLGALIMGVMLGQHTRAKELSSHMAGYKDFFLIAFFFEIGLSGLPNWTMVFVALVLVVLGVFKTGLFMYLFTRFNLRARTSLLASLSLSTYSEFGLIIAAIGVQAGWMSNSWLVTLALALSFSFVLASPFNYRAHHIFDRFKPRLMRLNTCKVHPDDEPTNLGDAEYLICGMGRIGRSVYRQLLKDKQGKIIGIDYGLDIVESTNKAGKNVIWGDVTDSNFWQNVDLSKIKMIFISFTNHSSNLNTSMEIHKFLPEGIKVGSVCEFRDQAKELHEYGVDFIYNYREQIGKEFANEFVLNHK